MSDITPRPGVRQIQIAGPDLNFRSLEVFDPVLTGGQILSYWDATPREAFVVLQWLPTGDIEELRETETETPTDGAPARFIVAQADRLYRMVLNDRSISWPEKKISEATLRLLDGTPEGQTLYIRREDVADEPIKTDEALALADAGTEVVYAKAEVWKINVQNVLVTSVTPTLTVRDAITKANFDPNQGWIIVLKTSQDRKQVDLDYVIDLRTPGIEKLRLTPREINNGEAAPAAQAFALLQTDLQGLEARGQRWSTVLDNGRRWLLLHDFELPAGYDRASATVAVEMPTSYPMAELDMFYCAPHLARLDGRPIPQTQVTEAIQGVSFQRWSRHRGPGAPWRAGVDTLMSHLALIDASLLREVEP